MSAAAVCHLRNKRRYLSSDARTPPIRFVNRLNNKSNEWTLGVKRVPYRAVVGPVQSTTVSARMLERDLTYSACYIHLLDESLQRIPGIDPIHLRFIILHVVHSFILS